MINFGEIIDVISFRDRRIQPLCHLSAFVVGSGISVIIMVIKRKILAMGLSGADDVHKGFGVFIQLGLAYAGDLGKGIAVKRAARGQS